MKRLAILVLFILLNPILRASEQELVKPLLLQRCQVGMGPDRKPFPYILIQKKTFSLPYFFCSTTSSNRSRAFMRQKISAFLKKKDLLAKTVEHFDQAHTHIDHQGIPMNHYTLPLIKN